MHIPCRKGSLLEDLQRTVYASLDRHWTLGRHVSWSRFRLRTRIQSLLAIVRSLSAAKKVQDQNSRDSCSLEFNDTYYRSNHVPASRTALISVTVRVRIAVKFLVPIRTCVTVCAWVDT